MKEIFKTLFKYKWTMLFIVVLLFLQAYCNLALPSYTSNIVNVGIEESGITSIVPERIRKSEFDKLLTYVDESNLDKVKSSYTCDNKVCSLNSKEDLTLILNIPMSKLSSASSDNENLNRSEIISYLKNEYKLSGVDIDSKSMTYIYNVGFKMVVTALLAMGITILSAYLSSKISARFTRDLRKKVVNKILSLETSDINDFSSASLITRCTNDITQIGNVVTIVLRLALFAPIMGIGAITKVIDSPIRWVIVLAVILVLVLLIISFSLIVPKFKKFQELLDRINLVSREELTGLLVVRAFSNNKFEEDKFDKANNDLTNNGLFIGKAFSLMMPALTFLMNSTAILIIFVGTPKVNEFSMQVGDLIAFITYTMQIISAFLMLSMTAIIVPRSMVSMKRISEIFMTKNSITESDKAKKVKEINELEFKDVYFRYKNSAEDVLRDINFTSKKGETIAFIGSTGSGKSTIINLLPRLFDVTSGKILIDGVNIKDIDIKSLRKLIGFVPQKGKLFKGTIKENLEFGQDKKDFDLIQKAVKISESEEFILREEDGFDRKISEGGSNVSGGQRQRLSIARALAKNPSILIFDDSFSALDTKTDLKVRHNLKKIAKDKIIFVVAQRISTIMDADKIIVLNNGEIESIGSHEELMKNSKIYKEIYSSQLGGDKIE